MNSLDPYTIAWMVFWVASIGTVLLVCAYLANQKPSDEDLDRQILRCQGKLDYLLRQRALRSGVKVPTLPSFKELRDRNEQMDRGES